MGQTEVSQTISAGQLNTISATVDGVVNGVQIVPLANEPTAESTQSGFNLVGTVPVAFEVNALDADGNIIVPPGTVPVTTLSPYGSGVSVTPVPGTANQFSVRVTAPASKTAFPSLYAGATDTYGDTVNSIITIKPVSAVYVGYASGGVALYDGFGKALSLPGAAFGGVKDPVALAYDYDDNYVFVADTGQGKLLAFDPLGNPVPGFAAPSVPGISGVTYDSNNKMIYAVGTSGISSYTTTGTAASATGAPSNATAIAFVANDSRNSTLNELAVCIRGGAPAIGIYSEAALQTNSFAIAGGPTSVAYAPYHTGVVQQIYDVRSGNIDGYDTSGGSALTVTDANNPFGAAIDQNNNDVYVTEQTTNAIVPYLSNLSAIDSAAASITTPSASGMSSPAGIAIAY
ncbi:MAG TPA: hypothetical protein VJP85_12810 [Candidatus Baltobacteraceae bacterium]|nr:hypothetical protein [Candidatus Baltobacteraceae bacterium]